MAALYVAVLLGQLSIEPTNGHTVGLGQLVVLEVKAAEKAQLLWLTLEPLELNYRTFDGGRAFVFSSGLKPGRVVLICTAVDWAGQKVEQKRHIIQIGDPRPPPPGPDPDPPPPDDPLTGLARTAYVAATRLTDNSKAGALAGNFEAIAAKIAAGASPAGGAALKRWVTDETRTANRETLGAQANLWRPWFEAIGAELDRLFATEAQQTKDAYQTAWNDIAKGLRRIGATHFIAHSIGAGNAR